MNTMGSALLNRSSMNSPKETTPSIQRVFRDLSQKEFADIEQASVLLKMGWSGAFGWNTLLESQRVLIISEAGAGKTYECRGQQKILWNKGEPAFYLELGQLALSNLRDLLSVEEEARLDTWLAAQSETATFFLDSIDELKLTLGSFEVALKRLSKAISGQLKRVRIIITSRPTAVDQQLIREYLPVPDPIQSVGHGESFADIAMGRQQRTNQNDKEAAPAWRSVALMPLTDAQIQEMASLNGVDDPDTLLADIRARNAEDFARRPQDLIELCSDWREHRRIRTHREQVAHNISTKLKPRTDRLERAQLSPDKALDGACRLALAALLTRKLTIRLSVEADQGGELGIALDPAVVLHDWTPEERETLLERALFGFASYGRVRFHHRSVVEFLAAQSLETYLAQGMPFKSIKRLLFVETLQGIKVVRPIMRPVAAWLAGTCQSIFAEVRDREPEVLFDHADPESLPIPQRIEVLRAYTQFYGYGGWRGLHTPRLQTDRFASPDLAPHVRELWELGVENREVRELLLDLIGAGPMPTCADIAHSVAIDTSASYDERFRAVMALDYLNDHRLGALIESMVVTPAWWPERLVRSAILQLFPRYISPAQLCTLLGRIQAPERRTLSEFGWMLPQRIGESDLTGSYLTALREGLTELVIEDLAWEEKWPHLVSKRQHLLSTLAAVCLRLIHAGEADESLLRAIAITLRLQREDYSRNESAQSLRIILAELSPTLREAIFWADDEFSESMHSQKDLWKRLYSALYRGPLAINIEQDGAWIRRALADKSRKLLEREMMLEVLLRNTLSDVDAPRDYLEALKQSVVNEPLLIERIDLQLRPREVDPEQAVLDAEIAEQGRENAQSEAEGHASWMRFWSEVAAHPETAFLPEKAEETTWGLWQVMQNSGVESRGSGWSRRFIEEHFSKDVADRLRASMQQIWRKDRPTLRHERDASEKDRYLVRWQLGLAAIAAESEDPNWAKNLSSSEAALAARYAPIELNGFPSWLEALILEHPAAVEETLGPDLSADLDEVASVHRSGMLLQNLSHSPDVIQRLFLPRVRIWLDSNARSLCDGENNAAIFRQLELVLGILIAHGGREAQEHIQAMAADQLQGLVHSPFMQIWLTTLMRLNPHAGTEVLERLLAPLEPAATGPAIDIFGGMFGERHSTLLVGLKNPSFTPAVLLRIARLAYQHVRRSDDIRHEGVFSPGVRDAAQDGRSAILDAIINATGTEAWAIKLEMIADPLFAHFRDRLALLARETAAEEVEGGALAESQVVILNRYYEAPPATRDDMFAMLIDRLDDLDDLLLQDDSPRDAWAPITEEKIMRREIARELRNASNNVYSVDQEAVTADEKETDIRLRVASSGQQGVIELKIGESWSGRELRDTVQSQLVTRYMAAESCRSGCLLVTVANGSRTWKHPDSDEVLDIYGLRAMLEAEVQRVAQAMGGSLRLAVRVLDLRPRLKGGAST